MMNRNRKEHPSEPNAPNIPEGLIGTWAGQDGDGLLFLTLQASGAIIIAYDSPGDAEHTGTFTVQGNDFMADLPDGTAVSLRFLLTGDTLILAGDTEGEVITLTRYHEAFLGLPPHNQGL